MKHWINTNYKTLIISAFLIPIITVAIVSISHVTQWYGISNPLSWAVYLSVGIEIAAMSALAAISANMGKNVYFPFIIVTLIQFIGNIFFAYEYIDMTSKMFQSWVELVTPLVGFMGVEPTDLIGHKRFLALFSGGLLPVISLSFLHMLVKFTEEDRLKDIKEDEDIHHKVIEDKIKHDEEETVTVNPDQLKILVEDAVRIKLSEKDLEILEETLLNPPKPNDNLIKAAEKYKLIKEAEKYKDTTSDDLDEEMGDFIPEISTGSTQIAQMSDLDDLRKQIIEELKVSNPFPENLTEKIREAFIPPTEEEKEEIDENERLKLGTTDLDNLERFISKKFEDPYDKELEEEFNEWDVTLQDGLEDELPFEESTDNLPIEEPEDFDGDVTDDYYPVKFEDDYYLGNNGQSVDIDTLPEPTEEDKKKLNTNIEEVEQVVEEDKKKDQLEIPLQVENIQSLDLEEDQPLTNDEDSVYFEQEETESNPVNINRKILSRNVNNTRRRGF